jgi:hypothetical protein
MNGHAQFQVISDQFDMQEDILRRARNGTAFLILRIDSSNPIVGPADQGSQQEWHRDGAVGGYSLGFTPQIGSPIVYLVRDRLQNEDIYYVTLHELGHALGARHDADGLMYRYYRREVWQCVDRLAIRQVASYYHWDIHTVNYCVVARTAAPPPHSLSLTESYQGR